MEFTNNGLFYSPLDVGLNEIRLIRLHPSRDHTLLPQCEIFHVSLDKIIEYNALSYTWGNSNLRGNIIVEGQKIKVGQNLAHTLSDIRHEEINMILWADALRIDQNNTSERNHQVKHMDEIYRKAKCVIAWLERPQGNENKYDQSIPFKLLEEESTSESTYRNLGPQPWIKLAALCTLPYWNRLWVVQEILLAARLIVYHGRLNIDWSKFLLVRNKLATLPCPATIKSSQDAILHSMPSRFIDQTFQALPPWFDA